MASTTSSHGLSEGSENMKDRLKASYDAMAPQYNEWTQKHSNFRLAYLEKLFEAVPTLNQSEKSFSVVELGCGAGIPILDTILSRSPNASVIGNDLSSTQIEIAKKNLAQFGDRANLIEGDMTKLSFPDESQDAVIGLYSIIHLPQAEQIAILRNINKWLKPGGCLLANFSGEASSGVTNEKWLDEKGWMFWSGLGPEQTVAELREAGFEVLHQAVEGDEEERLLWLLARKTS